MNICYGIGHHDPKTKISFCQIPFGSHNAIGAKDRDDLILIVNKGEEVTEFKIYRKGSDVLVFSSIVNNFFIQGQPELLWQGDANLESAP